MKRMARMGMHAVGWFVVIWCMAAALNSDGALAFPEKRPTFKIHVSLSRQIVTVTRVEDGTVERQMICSSGRVNAPTITGNYRLPVNTRGEQRLWYALSSGTWCHYATRISGSYLFHSILYSSPYSSSLKRDSWNMLGSKASDGCIRLTPLDAQWIAYNCEVGTLVTINTAVPPGPIKHASVIKKTLPKPNANGKIPDYEPTLTPTPRPAPPTLVEGIEGPKTKAMQTNLKSLGYFGGSVNGKFGANTGTAVERFQSRYLALNPSEATLMANGEATPEWQSVIKTHKADVNYAGTYRTLKSGATGTSVKALRQRLLALGYTTAAASTKYDARTSDAVRNVQRALGLTVNGTANPELQDALMSEDAKPLARAEVTKAGGLTLRKSRSTRGVVVAKLKNGAKLAIVLRDGDWCYVTNGKHSGYVQTQYIKSEDLNFVPAA